MNACWHTKQGNNKLLIFFNGWGCNEQILSGIDIPGYDLLIFYDYTRITDGIPSIPAHYTDIRLLAWSFGVFVAGALFSHLPEIHKRVAVNGTPWPIDDARGIPEKIFRMTLNHYNSEENRQKFLQRVIGDPPHPRIMGLQERSLNDQRAELESLSRMARSYTPEQQAQEVAFPLWDVAVISKSDKIFPADNMKTAWGNKAVIDPGNHLPYFHLIITHYILQ